MNTKEHIKNHFMDETICQTSIATEMEVSTSYLSRIFKQYTNQNMVDYINELRVEKAKLLLENEKLTLCEIAKMAGCSDISLIRIFKKHEGVTPGKYRDYVASKRADMAD
ncbi:MAG TPA: helix-turn-helix transcriptional regulator [Clostridiales bacterium]|nr:helix-turn-helix transcriptional regulator [Clostridiales bacterium]